MAEAADPLGGRLAAELELGRGRVQAQLPCQNPFCELLSTVNRESSMMMVVHSVSWLAFASQHQLPSSRPNGQQPIETSHLAPEEHGVGFYACLGAQFSRVLCERARMFSLRSDAALMPLLARNTERASPNQRESRRSKTRKDARVLPVTHDLLRWEAGSPTRDRLRGQKAGRRLPSQSLSSCRLDRDPSFESNRSHTVCRPGRKPTP